MKIVKLCCLKIFIVCVSYSEQWCKLILTEIMCGIDKKGRVKVRVSHWAFFISHFLQMLAFGPRTLFNSLI